MATLPGVSPKLPIPKSKPRVIEQSIEIDCPVEKLFRFHLDTRNAPRVSPGVTFDSIDGTFPLRDGAIVTIVMRQAPIPFPMTWRFRVEAVVLNKAVVDVAIASPFAAWRHEHRFESLGPERCRLTDRITYTPPFGPMGAIGDRLIVNRMLRKTFAQRQIITKRLMEAT
jgi:ligand-binding SRPBCC domain-containing protein